MDRSKTVKNIEDTISDTVSDFLSYNRKDDEDLPLGTIEDAVEKGWISLERIAVLFKREIMKKAKVLI